MTVCTARRRGVPFVRTKGTKIRLGLRPKTPTRRSPPARKAKATASRRIGAPGGTQGPLGKGGRTAAGRAARSIAKGQHDSSGGCVQRDDACKEQRRICPHPVPLPRFGGGASCPSVRFPKPAAFIMLSAVLSLSSCFPLSSPPLRRGQGWWFALPRSSAGAIKMRRRHRWSVSVRSTDDASHRSYPALQATKGGSSRGNLPLDPVLLPFAGAKGRPRRRAVLALHPAYSPQRRQATANYPPPGRHTSYAFAKGPAHLSPTEVFSSPQKKKAAGSRRLLIFSLITVSRYPAW